MKIGLGFAFVLIGATVTNAATVSILTAARVGPEIQRVFEGTDAGNSDTPLSTTNTLNLGNPNDVPARTAFAFGFVDATTGVLKAQVTTQNPNTGFSSDTVEAQANASIRQRYRATSTGPITMSMAVDADVDATSFANGGAAWQYSAGVSLTAYEIAGGPRISESIQLGGFEDLITSFNDTILMDTVIVPAGTAIELQWGLSMSLSDNAEGDIDSSKSASIFFELGEGLALEPIDDATGFLSDPFYPTDILPDDTSPIPVPAALPLSLVGFGALLVLRRRRRPRDCTGRAS